MRLCKMARSCAFLRVSALFCAFLRVFSTKMGCKRAQFAQNVAKMCKKHFYATPPLVIPPLACHRIKAKVLVGA